MNTIEQLVAIEALLKDALGELSYADTSDEISEEDLADIYWGINDTIVNIGGLINSGGKYK